MDSDSVKSGANVTDFKGTIIITGANGALGLSSVEALLQNYPSHFAMLTVRDDSASDTNTTQLRNLVASFQSCQASIEVLDLASLSSVRAFAQNVAERVSRKKIPAISAIVCNAFSWSLVDTKFSSDNYERTFQVSHLSHFVLVLMLLGSLDRTTGRIVLLGSDQHDSIKKNSLNPLGAKLPEDLDEIIKPTADKKGEEYSRGFQRYANSKLANVMFMHSLNRKLLQDPRLRQINAISMDPGGMPTSKGFKDTPLALRTSMYIAGRLLPLLQFFSNSIKTTKAIGLDLITMSLGPNMAGQRGYFECQKQANSSTESQNEVIQEEVWMACVRWARLGQSETILHIGGSDNGGGEGIGKKL